MRYRIDPVTGGAGAPVGHEMIVATAVFTLLIGLGFCLMGRRGRQHWVTAIGSVLVVSSAVYLGAVMLGFT